MKIVDKFYRALLPYRFEHFKNLRDIFLWDKNGRKGHSPHFVKKNLITYYQLMTGYNTLIESGTFRGDMIKAQIPFFKKIYSIELSEKLFKKAKQKFAVKSDVNILHGDSGVVLPSILKQLDEECIFWLDGHYSGGITAKGTKECPVIEELNAINNAEPKRHIILIDDARCFDGNNDYPTIAKIMEIMSGNKINYSLEVKLDIIILTPL